MIATKPKAKRSKPVLSERDVTEQIVGYLRAMGWTCVRQQSGLFSRPGSSGRIRIGEVGAADWYAYRALPNFGTIVEFFYMEFKAPGKTPATEQEFWMSAKRIQHIEADWFDCLDHSEPNYLERPERDVRGTKLEHAFIPWYRIRYGRRAGDLAGSGL